MASSSTSQKETTVADADMTRGAQIDTLSQDYAKYLDINVDKQVNGFNESIEEMLTHLDEYCGLVDIIRSDTSLCLNRTLPEIYKKSKEMEKIFAKIDKLEAYVAMVKKTENEIEKQLNKAESEMGSLGTFKKALGTFSGFFSSSPRVPPPSTSSYEPPEIFNTDQFISYGNNKMETTSTNSPIAACDTLPTEGTSDSCSVHVDQAEEASSPLDSDVAMKDSGISLAVGGSEESAREDSSAAV